MILRGLQYGSGGSVWSSLVQSGTFWDTVQDQDRPVPVSKLLTYARVMAWFWFGVDRGNTLGTAYARGFDLMCSGKWPLAWRVALFPRNMVGSIGAPFFLMAVVVGGLCGVRLGVVVGQCHLSDIGIWIGMSA